MSDYPLNRALIGDCRETLTAVPDSTFQCCVTSPPYWGLRDYGHAHQIGMEKTPEEYVSELVAVFREVRRVLRDDGTLWLNLGDSYSGGGGGGTTASSTLQGGGGPRYFEGSKAQALGEVAVKKTIPKGLKHKDLVGIPWRVAFALQADGWWLRSDIIWSKPSPMPESVTDRPTKAHEYVFLLAKSERYFFDAEAVREKSIDPPGHGRGGSLSRFGPTEALIAANAHRGNKPALSSGFRNTRSVWPIASAPYSGAHFATMPPKLAERCILAGSRIGSAILDPFLGSGTTGQVAEALGRKWLGCELSESYGQLIKKRTAQVGLPWPEEAA